MRPRLLPLLATGVLTLSLLGPVTAAADDRDAGPVLPEQAADAASEALDEAQAVFEERAPAAARRLLAAGGRDATMALNQLVRARADLSPSERRQADALLARPADASGGAFGDTYKVKEEPPVCGDNVCIHYVATTSDAPVMDDGPDVGTLPDSVELARDTAEEVNDTYVAAGYLPPDPDAGRGGDDRVDIYLSDLGSQALYGYCATDQPRVGAPWNRWAYCGIDDDFAAYQFPGAPLENLQVTLAHEYFHAVQFAYDASEDPWFIEATATWVEDEVFDAVDDNRQYLSAGQLRRPGIPLDRFGAGNNHYGNWLFFRRLTERWPDKTGALPSIVRQAWELASARAYDADLHSTAAIHSVLASRGSSFGQEYGLFASANRRPAATYEEGRSYPASPVTRRRLTLGPDGRRTATRAVGLDHLTHKAYRLTPDGTRRRDWRLRLDLDMPSRATAPVARLLTYRTNGRVIDSAIRLSRSGSARLHMSFSTRQVERVELVLVNASRRTRCWSRTSYACQGDPRDDDRRTTFSARVFRS